MEVGKNNKPVLEAGEPVSRVWNMYRRYHPKSRTEPTESWRVLIEKALEVTMEFVKNRKAFGQTIWDFQNTQFVLADLNARGTAARVFVNDCIAKHLKGELDVPTACMAKYMVTELQGEVVDKCLQFHGGAGFINDYPIARMYRDSRITRIFGGSNEVMKMVIARSM